MITLKGFNNFGQLIVDGGGDTLMLSKGAFSIPVVVTNFRIEEIPTTFERVIEHVKISVRSSGLSSGVYPIRISILDGANYGRMTETPFDSPSIPGDTLTPQSALAISNAICEAVRLVKERNK